MAMVVFQFVLSGLLKRLPGMRAWHTRCIQRMEQRFRLSISVGSIAWKNLLLLKMSKLTIEHPAKGLLFTAETVSVRFSLRHLFSPSGLVQGVTIRQGVLHRTSQGPGAAGKTTVAQTLERLYRRASSIAAQVCAAWPPNLQLYDCTYYPAPRCETYTSIRQLIVDQRRLEATVSMHNREECRQLVLTGTISGNVKAGQFTVQAPVVTCILQRAGHRDTLSIEQLAASVQVQWPARHSMTVQSTVNAASIVWNNQPLVHSRGGSKGLKLQVQGVLDDEGFRLQEGTALSFNLLQGRFQFVHPFKTGSAAVIDLQLAPCTMKELLDSLPPLEYERLYTASFSGRFGFSARLTIMLQPPFQYDFNVDKQGDIRLADPGELDLLWMQRTFEHHFRVAEKIVRSATMGAGAGSFVPLHDCPRHFRQAILLCEDRHFYEHRGVHLPSVGLALVTNLATRRFSRGSSTITMQLCRNLFLHRPRSLNKKMEELILTWLIEDVFTISKDRILELYLNIIEFAPGIYGIGEAAQFYFGKPARDLSLTESLLLTYIVPRPLHFVTALKNGSLLLAENLGKHISRLSEEMRERGYVTDRDTRQQQQEIRFNNGLGCISFNDPGAQLHPALLALFRVSADRWKKRYPQLPRPYIASTHQSSSWQQAGTGYSHERRRMDPHHCFPSMAFDIIFRDELGQTDTTVSLYENFALLVKEADGHNDVRWGGDPAHVIDVAHFELADWRALSGATVIHTEIRDQ